MTTTASSARKFIGQRSNGHKTTLQCKCKALEEGSILFTICNSNLKEIALIDHPKNKYAASIRVG